MAPQTAKDKGRRWWASKILRILYWRQVVSVVALITFAQEGYIFLEVIPVTAIETSRRDILPGFR